MEETMSSKPVELAQARSRLKELVDQASRGEEVILTEDGTPVARIIPVTRTVARRTFGSARGLIHMRDDFDDPIADFRNYM